VSTRLGPLEALEVRNLTKRYGATLAVDGVSLSVRRGGLWIPRAQRRPFTIRRQHRNPSVDSVRIFLAGNLW